MTDAVAMTNPFYCSEPVPATVRTLAAVSSLTQGFPLSTRETALTLGPRAGRVMIPISRYGACADG